MNNQSERAAGIRPNLTVRINTAKSFLKSTLFNFMDFTIVDCGLTVRSVTLHQKVRERWLSLPAREYAAADERKLVAEAILKAFDDFTAQNVGGL